MRGTKQAVVLSLLSIVLCFGACDVPITEDPIVIDMEKVSHGTFNDSVYVNDVARVRLRAPQGWKFLRPRKLSRVMVAGLRITDELVPADMFTMELHSAYTSRVATMMMDEKIEIMSTFFRTLSVLRKEIVTVAGKQSGLLVYSINPQGDAPVSRLYLVPHKESVVELLFVEPSSKNSALMKAIAQVLNSLEVY